MSKILDNRALIRHSAHKGRIKVYFKYLLLVGHIYNYCTLLRAMQPNIIANNIIAKSNPKIPIQAH